MTCSGERLSSSQTPKSALTHKVQTKLDVFHCNEYKFLYEFNKINALSAFMASFFNLIPVNNIY